MAEAPDTPLRKTPLHARHIQHGARMVPFGGWDMPVEYSGISDEHLAVRTRAGLFDVSHMGEVEIAGADALAAVQRISSNDASKLAIGQIQYSALMTPQGTFVDDLLVYRWSDSHFLLVINAGNIAKDFAWISRAGEQWRLRRCRGGEYEQPVCAAGGAGAPGVGRRAVADQRRARAVEVLLASRTASSRGFAGTVSRTGYTGEDGFEIFVPPAAAEKLWNAILEAGKEVGLVPAGLGARDTLRLEASMRLYGNDIDDTTTVLEADLGWMVGWKKDDFLGADVLRRQKAEGLSRKLVGFEMVDRAIARHGYDVYVDGEKAGVVTSGTQTPFLKKAIGMAYLPVAAATPDREFEIDIRGRRVRARVVPMPFYKRPRS